MEVTRPKHRKYHIIYKTTCTLTGKWYIGLHSTDDLNDGYQGSGSRLWKSIKKHGKNAHIVQILEHCEDRATLIRREGEIVTDEMLSNPMCMNIIKGGNANQEEIKTLREEARRKCKEAADLMWAKRKADAVAMAEHIKKIATPEIVAKRAKANTGKKRTGGQKQNLKAGQERYYSSAPQEVLKQRGQKAAVTRMKLGTNKGGRPKGIPMTEAQRAHLSVVNKGRQFVPRASCCRCRKETTLVALNRYHISCEPPQVNL